MLAKSKLLLAAMLIATGTYQLPAQGGSKFYISAHIGSGRCTSPVHGHGKFYFRDRYGDLWRCVPVYRHAGRRYSWHRYGWYPGWPWPGRVWYCRPGSTFIYTVPYYVVSDGSLSITGAYLQVPPLGSQRDSAAGLAELIDKQPPPQKVLVYENGSVVIYDRDKDKQKPPSTPQPQGQTQQQPQKSGEVEKQPPVERHEQMLSDAEADFANGRYESAAKTLLKLMIAEPDNLQAMGLYAQAMFASGNYRTASYMLRRCIAIDAEQLLKMDVKKLYGRVEILDLHLRRLADYLDRNPRFADGWLLLGYELAASGSRTQALEALNHAAKLAPAEVAVTTLKQALQPPKQQQQQPQHQSQAN